jgi:excisionase family DNA binding protein
VQDQGNADGFALPVTSEPTVQTRPEWVAAATAAVDAVRSGDLDAVRAAQQEGPDGPYLVAEVAVALGVSKSTIYKAVETGELRGMRFGNTRKGTIRIPHGALVDYVAACTEAAVTRPGVRQRSLVVEIRDVSSSLASAVPVEVA